MNSFLYHNYLGRPTVKISWPVVYGIICVRMTRKAGMAISTPRLPISGAPTWAGSFAHALLKFKRKTEQRRCRKLQLDQPIESECNIYGSRRFCTPTLAGCEILQCSTDEILSFSGAHEFEQQISGEGKVITFQNKLLNVGDIDLGVSGHKGDPPPRFSRSEETHEPNRPVAVRSCAQRMNSRKLYGTWLDGEVGFAPASELEET